VIVPSMPKGRAALPGAGCSGRLRIGWIIVLIAPSRTPSRPVRRLEVDSQRRRSAGRLAGPERTAIRPMARLPGASRGTGQGASGGRSGRF